MLKLRFSKPSIKTYADGKITVCKYDCTLINGNSKRVMDEFSVTGTSKCSPNDILDAAYGRKLADSRAKLNAYKIAARIISPKEMERLIEKVNYTYDLIRFVDTMQYLKKKEIDHIKFLNEEFD